jgi:hypothetical protein
MTPEKINQAIAEECGWRVAKLLGYHPGDEFWFVPPEDVNQYLPHVFMPLSELGDYNLNIMGGARKPLPNYFADLNACREMEETIKDPLEKSRWFIWMQRNTDVAGIQATAPQRCEAFLRLKGKWVE